MRILVTGAYGFVGKNVVETLKTIRDGKNKSTVLSSDIQIYEYDVKNSLEDLRLFCRQCDFVIHLAGVNRPTKVEEFFEGNKGFTETLCTYLKEANNQCPILISSSIQVGKDNDYAHSKLEGENLLLKFEKENGNKVFVYRFANLFGKWCRPNYNSVTATWCYNIAHNKQIQVDDPSVIVPLCYIDDVVKEIVNCMSGNANYDYNRGYYTAIPIYEVSLGKMKELLYSFKESRVNLSVVNQGDAFTKKLYATYLSYLPEHSFSYSLKMNVDQRGSFTEFLKTKEYGQISINVAHPGITKGEHWHHTKNEKFLVVSGCGVIQFRDVRDFEEKKVIEYHVSGEELEVVDIPTGYTHNIINTGENDMVTLMWANEQFDSENPDTYFERVIE